MVALVAIKCDAPPTGHGTKDVAITGSSDIGEVYSYTCLPGHEVAAKESLTSVCLSNGTWSLDSPPYCIGKMSGDGTLAPYDCVLQNFYSFLK